ncbi:MAG: adenosylcobinamide kinase [Sulfurimonas sp. RIFOXYD12_FULL_33_39]|uniref:bifunctional adenosylcobinamide kinase/adenosylcobinamide-phosphate guanylyltransferase n=1 Tax=unclassified Sulfurimonas TaxID=2623549 RepID=UPI0008D811EF|nr:MULTISPECIES: bifunctional adenosylcobinamide kinase/adenosylcobinamide-phosphate guanylyltransferase [unclassified Sulfurimonas]OHE07483.1 MAG: adenosylcobinamide kinase [Sulfurimonas sp. RIFCSPLOWO2_12_FULL_34_6]OHE10807.1 MAG: adenosylcobinamide kinase [Sulfurimonas sp. RIFOXYD12_FULL_33_39]OHE13423.1 MAG: adenosylcobinamide kinase [Sulfurimonas sp. RIFOXYD2_FULL_34_21]DAB28767.1 MAG TPA: adenosylcobinamide kinase [Sulfurimonas sp. UBA10385]
MKTKKTLFIGGIKSGKSFNAELYILKGSVSKPTYLATTEFIDKEMQERIDEHKQNRSDKFNTIEEPLKLYNAITECDTPVLVECVSMWINNMLYHGFNFLDMKKELEKILELDKSVVFVLNDVGGGIIPDNALAREFIDISGKLSQLIARECDEVYHTIAGISTRIK